MKRLLVALVVAAGFAACGLFGSHALSAESDYGVGACNAYDRANFPYGFLCGGNPYDSTNVTINATNVGSSILQRSTDHIDFTVRWNPSDQARTRPTGSGPDNPGLLVWATIDINDDIWNGFPSISGGGASRQCPGSGVPEVRNFQDLQPNGSNGRDASPAAYTGSSGYENCGSEGKAVYWTMPGDGSTGNTRTFRMNIDPTISNRSFCVRANVSVNYGDSRPWPAFDGDQNNTAAHVAKQSELGNCFNVYNHGVDGYLSIKSCTTYQVTWAHDLDHWPNAPATIRVVRASNGADVTGSRITDSAGNTSDLTTLTPFIPGQTYKLQVRDPDANAWSDVPAGHGSRTLDAGCSDEKLPYADRAMDCNMMYIHNMYDPNSTGNGVYWEATLYDGQGTSTAKAYYNSDTNPEVVSVGADGHEYVNISINPAFETNNVNDGWTAKLTIHNVPSGGNSSPATTPHDVTVHSPTNCYTASCTAKVKNPIPDTTNGIEAGKDFYVEATLTNLGDAATLDGTNFGVTFDNNDTWKWGRGAGYNHFPSGSNASRGGPVVSFDIGPFRAPDDISSWNMGFYADFIGHYPLMPDGGTMPSCSLPGGAIADVYKPFELTPHAGLVGFDSEDPQTLQYHTWITDNTKHVDDSGPGKIGGIPASTTRTLFKMDPVSFNANDTNKLYGGIATLFDSGADNNTRILTNTEYASAGAQPDHRRDYGTSGVFINPPGTYTAGDQYCARLTVDHGTGYIGPSDKLAGEKAATDYSCPNVTNKPYFKVFGGSISAGGQFKSISGNCASPGEGILAGYNNNIYSGYDFGASAQLTALAMNAITGVASGQTKYDKSPTRLSFSNTENITSVPTSDYSPSLGGNFNTGAGAGACLTTAEPDPEKPLPAISDGALTAAMDGQYVYNGTAPLKISGGQIGHNVSIFTDTADVIITPGSFDGIKYSTGTWNKSNVPSLVIHSKGDIYIDKDVGVLDGMFISEKPGGRISTCTTAAGGLVVNDGSYYDNCKKQLTIHGSFVADRINLMRTYGTMRDEKPTASPGHTKLDMRWVTGAAEDDPNPLGFGYNCVNTIEGFVPGLGWEKAYLCLPASSGVSMAWSCDFDSTFTQATAPVPCRESQTSLNARGFTNCTQWLNDPTSWHDNMLCWSGGDPDLMKYTTSPIAGRDCTLTITQSQDPGWRRAYICQAPTVPSVMTGLPTTLNCSNNGGTTFNRPVAGTSAGTTCAAEVFDFSPEQYLSHPAILPPNKGAMVWDSVTSLPPVL